MSNVTDDIRTEAVIDWGILDTLKAIQKPGSPDIRSRLIKVFLDSSPPLAAAIMDASASLDGPSLTKAAHSLKSSSMNMGAGGLTELCAQLEGIGRSGNFEGVDTLVNRFNAQYEAVAAAFRQALQQYRS